MISNRERRRARARESLHACRPVRPAFLGVRRLCRRFFAFRIADQPHLSATHARRHCPALRRHPEESRDEGFSPAFPYAPALRQRGFQPPRHPPLLASCCHPACPDARGELREGSAVYARNARSLAKKTYKTELFVSARFNRAHHVRPTEGRGFNPADFVTHSVGAQRPLLGGPFRRAVRLPHFPFSLFPFPPLAPPFLIDTRRN